MAADGTAPHRQEEASPAQEAELLVRAVTTGARVAMGFFRGRVAERLKADGSPVTDADVAADEAMSMMLRGERPHYGWLSEELGAVSGAAARTFIVDPIDGTRAFLRGETGWTVVAAVVEEGRPIAAAVLRPARGELYHCASGGGAHCNGVRLHISRRRTLSGARAAMPGPLYRDGGFRALGVLRARTVPSLALRLAKVAGGTPDAAITRAGAHHWDLAASDLMVHEAGGIVTTLAGTLPRYDAETTAHPPLVAGPPDLADALRAMAARCARAA